jgi:hypothetical protein
MLKQKSQQRCFEWLLIAALTFFMNPASAANGLGVISGQVTDINGVPIAGVTVSSKDVAGVVTNPGGVFTLTGVKQKSLILVNFTKPGYVPSQGSASLVTGATKTKDGNSDEGGSKLPNTALVQVLLKSGANKSLNATTGGSLSESGSKVTFPANSLTVAGNVNVIITTIDVSTNQIQGSPGSFSARTASGQIVPVRSFSMADFSLSQNGQKVNLKTGATANIELLLPANTLLSAGAVKPMWYFNTANGLWQEEGTGAVSPSTTTPGRLAVMAAVKHFTWWSLAEPVVLTAITGRILNDFGFPLANSSVTSLVAGIGYAVAETDETGVYCIEAPVNSETRMRAYAGSAQGTIAMNEWTMFAGPTPAACPSVVQQAPNITLIFNLFCITGTVADVSSLPVSGATVISSAGGFVATDSSGAYRLDVVSRPQNIFVNTLGYNTVAITPPISSNGPCMAVNFNPSPSTACLSGVAMPNSCGYSPSKSLILKDSNGNMIGSASPTGTGFLGGYCFDGLPADTPVGTILPNQIIPDWISPIGGSFTGTTGSAGRSCSSNNCSVGPTVQYDCPT